MIGQPGRRRKELLEGRPLRDFPFLRPAAVAASIQVLVEERADVKLVERIGYWFLRNFLRFFFEEGLVTVIVRLGGLFALLFENWVGDHFLVDHLAQLEAVQGQHADHLNEARRENLLLRHFEVEFESLPGHRWSRSSLRNSSIQAEVIAKVHAPHLGIGAQFLGTTLPEYFPTFQDISVIRHAESFPDVMIGN